MSMNEDLARLYGTPGAQEEMAKQAEAELFCKLAAENNIDLNQLNEAQIGELWEATFGKSASADNDEDDKGGDKDKDEDEEEKEAAAAAEHRALIEQQNADMLGRKMAHAYVQELGYIGDAMDKQAAMPKSLLEAGMRGRSAAKNLAGKVKDIATAKQFREGRGALQHARSAAGGTERAKAVMGRIPKGQRDRAQRTLGAVQSAAAKQNMRAGAAKTLGLYGGGAAAAGGAGYAATRKKESSALDEYALEVALQKVAEANFDMDEAVQLLGDVFAAGTPDPEKVASTLEDQVEVRSLELLEAAGYPIDWA